MLLTNVTKTQNIIPLCPHSHPCLHYEHSIRISYSVFQRWLLQCSGYIIACKVIVPASTLYKIFECIFGIYYSHKIQPQNVTSKIMCCLMVGLNRAAFVPKSYPSTCIILYHYCTHEPKWQFKMRVIELLKGTSFH